MRPHDFTPGHLSSLILCSSPSKTGWKMFSSPSIALSGFHFQAFALDEAFRAMVTPRPRKLSAEARTWFVGSPFQQHSNSLVWKIVRITLEAHAFMVRAFETPGVARTVDKLTCWDVDASGTESGSWLTIHVFVSCSGPGSSPSTYTEPPKASREDWGCRNHTGVMMGLPSHYCYNQGQAWRLAILVL